MFLISRCCVGMPCRYRHNGHLRKVAIQLGSNEDFLAVCPEQLGGLPTPREGCNVVSGRVIGRKSGTDYTAAYEHGAHLTLALAQANNIKRAFLLSESPSCGNGYGITALLLTRHGIKITPI